MCGLAGIVLERLEAFSSLVDSKPQGVLLPRSEQTIPLVPLDAIFYRNLRGRWVGSQWID